MSIRLKKFFAETSMPKTVVAKKLKISTSTIYHILNESLSISEELEERFNEYLVKWGY